MVLGYFLKAIHRIWAHPLSITASHLVLSTALLLQAAGHAVSHLTAATNAQPRIPVLGLLGSQGLGEQLRRITG